MSAYVTLATPIIDEECLLLALSELGFGQGHVEVHESPVALVGYEGGQRQERAEVIIRRQHVGASSNDLGFQRTPTGYRAIISDYDRGRYGSGWLQRLYAAYQGHERRKQQRLEEEARAAAEEARRRAEEERRRLEEERRRVVEAQRQAVHDKAKRLGYAVKETREGERVRLVLVKRVY